ncbi:MAG TPA: hypothetical protein VGF01_15625, partial [Terracidiphilus sp.]
MRKTNRSGRGGHRRSDGNGEPDLFTQQLAKVVEQAFATVGGESEKESADIPAPPIIDQIDLPAGERTTVLSEPYSESVRTSIQAPPIDLQPPPESLPARMLNEFVYCPRLFYYEQVEGVFVESADTVKGAAVHARVDKGKGALPQPMEPKNPTESSSDEEVEEAKIVSDGDEIHSRSVMLGSERLGVVAKMDLVEATLDENGGVAGVCPVDYKV